MYVCTGFNVVGPVPIREVSSNFCLQVLILRSEDSHFRGCYVQASMDLKMCPY